eukprot:CAMPEP_0196776706 /NCGR_PEP_ID=MMETSP1104-20130614/4791_1 /TAXON_ID=33652 /ORGANISM="Cafeteria sp., Strain Caron Lab Isolate" /LENGTH=323 /DNA_ID=CAMNT_0042146873 /DNA_START=21 /DNA_END=989 /DNA_ORIENTATION=+
MSAACSPAFDDRAQDAPEPTDVLASAHARATAAGLPIRCPSGPIEGIQVVAFDLDDTLWSCSATLQHARRRFFDFFRANFPRIADRFTLDDFTQRVMKAMKDHPFVAHDFDTLNRIVTAQLATECGYPPCDVVEPAYAVFCQARNEVEFFPGALEGLARLRDAGFAICAVSNGNARVHRIPAVAHLFTFSVDAAQAGAPKPDAAIFRCLYDKCAAHFGVTSPAQIMVVGDSLHCDVAGAVAAGMRAAWVMAPRVNALDRVAASARGAKYLDQIRKLRLPSPLPVAAVVGGVGELPDLMGAPLPQPEPEPEPEPQTQTQTQTPH